MVPSRTPLAKPSAIRHMQNAFHILVNFSLGQGGQQADRGQRDFLFIHEMVVENFRDAFRRLPNAAPGFGSLGKVRMELVVFQL
jgi:hypothetical protein